MAESQAWGWDWTAAGGMTPSLGRRSLLVRVGRVRPPREGVWDACIGSSTLFHALIAYT